MNATQSMNRLLWRVFGATALVLGAWLAVPTTPAHATSACDGSVGEECGTQVVCLAPIPGAKACIKRYFYREHGIM